MGLARFIFRNNRRLGCVTQVPFSFIIQLNFRACVHWKTVLISGVHCGLLVLRGNVSDTIESNLSRCLQVKCSPKSALNLAYIFSDATCKHIFRQTNEKVMKKELKSILCNKCGENKEVDQSKSSCQLQPTPVHQTQLYKPC